MNRHDLARSGVFSASVRLLAIASFVIGTLVIVSPSSAVNIVDMNFNGPTGLENTGVGPNGVLLAGASINHALGQLDVVDTTLGSQPIEAGLDLPLGALSPFGGGRDFSVSFDFNTTDTKAVLFSADGSWQVNPDDFPGDQAGSLNIFLDVDSDTGIAGVFADFWFVGGVGAGLPDGGTVNDGKWHNLLLNYDQSTMMASLTLDGILGEATSLVLNRDASMDKTRLGDDSNADFGADVNDGVDATFDNLLIKAGPQVPEPSSWGLLVIGSCALVVTQLRIRIGKSALAR